MAPATSTSTAAASDGVHPPAAVMEMAAAHGVRTMALTDHDTTDGLAEAAKAAIAHGIRLMPGIELSTDLGGVDCHLLGYGCAGRTLAPGLSHAAARRPPGPHSSKSSTILRRNGMPISASRVLEIAGEASVGRPHVARALVEPVTSPTVQEAFERWLGNGKPADVDRREKLAQQRPSRCIHAIGGIVAIAHTPSSWATTTASACGHSRQGRRRIETYYKHYPADAWSLRRKLADECGASPVRRQ